MEGPTHSAEDGGDGSSSRSPVETALGGLGTTTAGHIVQEVIATTIIAKAHKAEGLSKEVDRLRTELDNANSRLTNLDAQLEHAQGQIYEKEQHLQDSRAYLEVIHNLLSFVPPHYALPLPPSSSVPASVSDLL